ncbi:MAG: YdcF family protein [Sphingomonas sp.]
MRGTIIARSPVLPVVAALLLAVAPAGAAAPVPDRVIATLAYRLFPLLSAWPAGARGDNMTAALSRRRQRITACDGEVGCVMKAARWTDAERNLVAAAAGQVDPRAWRGRALPDDGAQAEVTREIEGLNAIITVYGQGQPPRYPEIDGPDTNHAEDNAKIAVATAAAGGDDPATSLDPSMGIALALLDANDQDDAAAFEPLDARYNSAAIARARTVDWSRYRFTAIIVPGVGPDDLATPLSAASKLNVRMAARLWAKGVAPFLLFTGGTVHPRGTHYAEALQMARAMSERFGAPADAIVVDPYARHTTTNLRNATRRLAALGAPLDRPALISTNPAQSRYIEGREFAERNRRELGYQPGRIGARLSPTELVFYPSPESFRVDPRDPLDP